MFEAPRSPSRLLPHAVGSVGFLWPNAAVYQVIIGSTVGAGSANKKSGRITGRPKNVVALSDHQAVQIPPSTDARALEALIANSSKDQVSTQLNRRLGFLLFLGWLLGGFFWSRFGSIGIGDFGNLDLFFHLLNKVRRLAFGAEFLGAFFGGLALVEFV